MPNTTLGQFIRRLRAAGDAAGPADAELLDRFAGRGESEAFELLVWRHSGMVWGICRRILGQEQDAEDAFQAAFLVLARKARTAGRRGSVGGWLYRVAVRVALAARARARTRVGRERPLAGDPADPGAAADPAAGAACREVRAAIDEEVARLPGRYRHPFVLCCLEGWTAAAAARELGCPVGTVQSRLARARARVRAGLTRRGLTLPAALTSVSVAAPVEAVAPAPLVALTARGAALAAGPRWIGGMPAPVAALVRGKLKTMWIANLKIVGVAVLLAGLAGGAAVLLARGVSADGPASATAPPPAPAAPAPPPPPRPEDLAGVTASLAGSHQTYLGVGPCYHDPGQDVPFRAVISPVSAADLRAGALKGHWDRMAAGLARRPPGGRRYAAVVAVHDQSSGRVVFRDEADLDPGPLAWASRARTPGRTAHSVLDAPAVVRGRIPAGKLRAGAEYRITLSFRDPDGREHRFPDGSTPETGCPLIVRAAPLDLDRLTLPGQVADAPGLLTGATELAAPGRRQFPGDDPDDCQARSVWCLQPYRGRVYVGYGDWGKNRGPIQVWSFAPEARDGPANPGRYGFSAGQNPRVAFTHEYTVQEHSIDRFRVCAGRLAIPGIDGCREGGPDGMAFGSVYIREKGYWRMLSSLPQARHVYDVLQVGGRLFAAADGPAGPVAVSDDDGLSWRPLTAGGASPAGGELAALGDGLLVLGGTRADVYRGGELTSHRGEFTPGCEPDAVHRAVPFLGGVVYTTADNYGRSRSPRHPLFFLRDPAAGARLVGPFRDRNVRDLFADGGKVYVLTGRAAGEGRFAAEVYASGDLRAWERLAAFTVPAMPSAVASLGGTFYVGLANRGYGPVDEDSDLREARYGYADRAAGGIWRVGR
jgi:RNA polymerase sigma factor (sigma-70 family)